MIYLAHHGVKGQKWGVRRYQNLDGSMTALGKQRYYKKYANDDDTINNKGAPKKIYSAHSKDSNYKTIKERIFGRAYTSVKTNSNASIAARQWMQQQEQISLQQLTQHELWNLNMDMNASTMYTMALSNNHVTNLF